MEFKMFKYLFRGRYMPLVYIIENLGIARGTMYYKIADMLPDETKTFDIKNKKTNVVETVTVTRLN